MSERSHPYELVFARPEFEDEQFAAIRDEAAGRDVDVRDTQRFVMLESVGELMRSLLPPDATLPATTQFAAIVTHAYHYWLAGRKTFGMDEASVRMLLDPGTSVGRWDMTPPGPAG